jgi:hypothetical protein
MGSNRGADIDRWQAEWGMSAEPWCAIFVAHCYHAANVDGDGVLSPATAVIVDQARARGLLISTPIPGCIIDWYGQHAEVVEAVLSPTVVQTIGGNVADQVMRSVRSTSGAYLVAPRSIRGVTRTVYSFQDPRGRVLIAGTWKLEAYARHTIANLGRIGVGATPVLVDGWWRVRLASDWHYGSDLARRGAMAERAALAARQGDRACHLRAYNSVITD